MERGTKPPIDKPLNATDAGEKLDEIAAVADQVGVRIPGLDTAREKVERSRRFLDERKTLRMEVSETADRIARQLVAGELDLQSAVTASLEAEARAPGTIWDRAVTRTEVVAARAAFAEVGKEIDGEAVLDQCREVVRKTVEEVRRLRPALAGITDAEQATAAGPKAAKAWSSYVTELLPRFEATHHLVELLRGQHWIAPLPTGVGSPRFAFPREAQIANQAARREGRVLLRLLDPIYDEFGPGGPFRVEELGEINKLRGDSVQKDIEADEALLAKFKTRPKVKAG